MGLHPHLLWQISLGDYRGQRRHAVGMIPARLLGYGEISPAFVVIPGWATVLTSMFMHGGFMHLGLNMLFLWIFAAL